MKLAVFVSGKGTNLLNIRKKHEEGFLKSEVVLVVSNRECDAVADSRKAGIVTAVIDPRSFHDEEAFAGALIEVLLRNEIEFIVLAGYLAKVPEKVVSLFENKIINIHPALLPAFGGKGMYGMKVHQAVIDYGCKVSGATVHIVDNDYDHGAVVLQKCIQLEEDETTESLARRIHNLEYELLPSAIRLFEENKLEIRGRKVRVIQN
ncbi:MAG: phosphoribosylglycinamide formyltransferase [Candidatus Kryptoniota bacterium]